MAITQTSGYPLTTTVTFDQLATVALFNLGKKKVFYEQFIRATPLLDILNQKTKVIDSGAGEVIKRDVRYGEGAPIYGFSKDQKIPVSESEDKTSTIWPWKNCAGGCKVNMEDIIQISDATTGPAFDLLADSLDWVMRGFSNAFDAYFFQDGSAQNNSVPYGLEYLVPTDPTQGSPGGLNRANYEWWRNVAIDAAGLWTQKGIFTPNDKFLALYSLLSYGKSKIDIIISHPTMLEWYERMLPDWLFLTKTSGDIDLGYGTLSYKGIPWVADRNCPEDRAYFLNLESFEFLVSKTWNMQPTEFYSLAPLGIMAKVAFIILRAQFICVKPMANGVVFGYTGYN